MTIEAVVFDIGNVLITWDPHGFYDRKIGSEKREALFQEVALETMNDGVDLGEPFAPSVAALAAKNPDWAQEIQCWHDNWLEMASPEIPHSVRLLRALRAKGIPVFALSNFGVQTYEIANGAYPFLAEFDREYISGHLKMAKPNAEFYAYLETDSGVAPDRLLFADDRADNIEAAAARGWQTHLFTGPQGWATRLVAEGLLSEDEAA